MVFCETEEVEEDLIGDNEEGRSIWSFSGVE